ncbi:MAG: hypothetical protein Q4A13_06335 [Fretibacterium sp.]|nr:hypothetical protein [Fretibacterium sp.]
MVDAHVHFNNPRLPDREDFAHGTAAERAVVDYALWGGLVDDNVSELRAMRDDERVRKAYLGGEVNASTER